MLYWDFHAIESDCARPFITNCIPKDRHLNSFYGIKSVNEYTEERLNGDHLIDGCHHSYQADLLLASNLIIPFIQNYCSTHDIMLDTV